MGGSLGRRSQGEEEEQAANLSPWIGVQGGHTRWQSAAWADLRSAQGRRLVLNLIGDRHGNDRRRRMSPRPRFTQGRSTSGDPRPRGHSNFSGGSSCARCLTSRTTTDVYGPAIDPFRRAFGPPYPKFVQSMGRAWTRVRQESLCTLGRWANERRLGSGDARGVCSAERPFGTLPDEFSFIHGVRPAACFSRCRPPP